eukprot:CAMPEP_0119103664 /NCGR_PEP_ID=MMETSP1180-20130426/2059_1 /TAXON_ID=3052 ORGANISM="Chlamydomonas cf sp, Strain CCMP681" /NCGR_SAMPLE_ID=MMETSP1180 /ASSEMBLY_ACC=CAM_ASM_000741 /LENGTH=62 /DNA_ID=CAMNT_0007088229 /DNA_START=87 /DNA_END=272 /DNA_ORIENTATION=-
MTELMRMAEWVHLQQQHLLCQALRRSNLPESPVTSAALGTSELATDLRGADLATCRWPQRQA